MSGHIVLVSNPFRDEGLHSALHCAELLRSCGFKAVIAPIFADKYGALPPLDEPLCELEEAVKGAELMVCFGGDGTLLQAAQLTLGSSVPMLGINLGHKGFLTEFSADEIDLLPSALLAGFTLQPRMMLHAELVRNGETILAGEALNDVTVNGIVNTIRLAAYGDEEPIMEFGGDGIIVATPTGATAYSLSAGGPLMEPDAENILITPICAHTLTVRCFVLSPRRKVMVRPVELGDRRAVFSIDGSEPIALQDGDTIRVERSPHVIYLAKLPGKGFYETVYDKLSER